MDDPVLELVRKSLAPVHMGRPLEVIEARGRAYRRNRLAGLAGVGLSVGLGLALVLSTTGLAPHDHSKVVEATTAARQADQRIDLAAFALSSEADGTVTVTFKEAAADPKALEKVLTDAGVTALVRVDEWCAGRRVQDAALEARLAKAVHSDGRTVSGGPTLTIRADALPKNVILNLRLQTDKKDVVLFAEPVFLMKEAQPHCFPIPVKSRPQLPPTPRR